MTRPLPSRLATAPLLALLAACGPNAELVRYTVDVSILDVPPWLDASTAGPYHEVLPCTNAEIFDKTIRVYDGWVEGSVTAITFVWTGFDLSHGGANTETVFLLPGETYGVPGALLPDTVLYEIDDRGRMIEVDKDLANVRSNDRAEAEYVLGEGLVLREEHEVAKERDLVDFIEQGTFNCELTQP